MRLLSPVCALACWSLLTVTGHAQTPAEADQATSEEEARSLFRAGQLAFDDGRFDDALTFFERAHTRSGRAELLYNVGLAADRLRRDERALDAFVGYLEATPDTPHRRQVEGRIAGLRAAIAEHSAAENDALEPEVLVDPSPEDRVETRPRHRWSWVLAGTALAAGATGGGLWARASRSRDDAAQTCAPTCSDDVVDPIARRVQATRALSIVAGVLGATAVVAFLIEHRRRPVEVLVGAGGAAIRGRF